jgi:predicted Mrr-cat superfamily restriction endonuclease
MDRRAFVLSIAPSEIDRVPMALESDTIIIGWSLAEGLLDEALSWEQFREKLIEAYPEHYKANLRKAGSAAGNMWRFIHEMKHDDLVVARHHNGFYVAKIVGDAEYRKEEVEEDTAYRRRVVWLNDKKPIPRDQARAALYSRMKAYQTCVDASDLVSEIEAALEAAHAGKTKSFGFELTDSLSKAAVHDMRRGYINEQAFERLVAVVLKRLGASVTITPRAQDVGDDIVAQFKELGITGVAQVKWHPDPDWRTERKAVDQVLDGIEKHKCGFRLGGDVWAFF